MLCRFAQTNMPPLTGPTEDVRAIFYAQIAKSDRCGGGVRADCCGDHAPIPPASTKQFKRPMGLGETMKIASIGKASVPVVAGVIIAGILLKFGGTMPVLKDAREGLGG